MTRSASAPRPRGPRAPAGAPDPASPSEIAAERENALAEGALQLARAAGEADVAGAVRAAARTLVPGRPVRVASSSPGGWHLILTEDTRDPAVLRIPLRAGGLLLESLSVLGAEPLLPVQAGAIAELASHAALALARLEYGQLISGVTPATDSDAYAAGSFRDPLTNLASRMLFHDRVEHALHRRAAPRPPGGGHGHRPRRLDHRGQGGDGRAGQRPVAWSSSPSGSSVWSARRTHRLASGMTSSERCSTTSTAPRTPALVAERLLGALQEPFRRGGRVPVSLQAHIGIAVNSGAAESAVELLHKAERAAQEARSHGVGFDAHPGRPRVHEAAQPVGA